MAQAARPEPLPEFAASHGDQDAASGRSETTSTARDPAPASRIKELPREVGVMLVSVGVLGFVLPGIMGTPALVAGGLVLWPGAFGAMDQWLRRRNPVLYDRGMQQLGRFLDDFESRYPDAKRS
jgi:hypothetical protein